MAISDTGSHDWWKHMMALMGLDASTKSGIQELANKTTTGDCASLANTMNTFFVSVSEHLPRLDRRDPVFTVHDELNKYVFSMHAVTTIGIWSTSVES